MQSLKELEEIGTAAVKRLRIQSLQNGESFMINTEDSSQGQCYLEYPNGSIALVELDSSKRDFKIIRELSIHENNALREKYNLPL